MGTTGVSKTEISKIVMNMKKLIQIQETVSVGSRRIIVFLSSANSDGKNMDFHKWKCISFT